MSSFLLCWGVRAEAHGEERFQLGPAHWHAWRHADENVDVAFLHVVLARR